MLRPTKSVSLMLVIALGFGFITGCKNDAQNTALIGAVIGTGIGAISGGGSDGMVIGAAAGGGIGYLIGNESDKKKANVAKGYGNEMDSSRSLQDTEVVWITNSNGSKTPVKLQKGNPGYVGPRNDHYASLPSEDQLRLVYGF